MLYFIIAIIILTIILYFLQKDIYKVLRTTSIITISSGYLSILIGYIITNTLKNQINFINISKITNILFNKNLEKGLILILIGALELIIYTGINIYKRYKLEILDA